MPPEDPVPSEGSAPRPPPASARVCPACAYRSEVVGEQFCPRDGAYLVDPKDLREAENDKLLGRRISEFAIVARIGTGGMGTVYRAIQIGMDRQVALKVLRADLTDDPQVVQRFLQEAKATARLQHRNLAVTYTSGSTPDGLFYIAMEYITGGSLAQLIERSWVQTERGAVYTLEPARAMRLFCQVVGALAHAHRLGIVHRDLKPDNVLLQLDEEEGEQAKIVDFGIAKILWSPDGKSGLVKTDAHANLGTALYMAPERFAGAPGDPRLDVYALGQLLHELLTGLLPFGNRYEDRETPTILLHKRLTMAVPALASSQGLSPQIVALHADLLDREPQRRPANAGEVRNRLREVPEAVAIRGPVEVSGGLALSAPETPLAEIIGLDGRPAARSIPPLPAGRSLPPAARSFPPSTRDGQPANEALPPTASSLPPGTPASISMQPPPGGTSPPFSATSLSSTATSHSPDSFPPHSSELPTVRPANNSTSRAVTIWLLAGCALLLVLLVLLALS